MALVKELNQSELLGNKGKEKVYPVTTTSAVFNEKGIPLSTLLKAINGEGYVNDMVYLEAGYIKLEIDKIPYLIPAFRYEQPIAPILSLITSNASSARRGVIFKLPTQANAVIHYTTDGSEPTADSPVCSSYGGGNNVIMVDDPGNNHHNTTIVKAITEIHGILSLVTSVEVETSRHLPAPVVHLSGTEYDSVRTMTASVDTAVPYNLKITVNGTTRPFAQEFPFAANCTGTITAEADGWESSSTNFEVKVKMTPIIFSLNYNGHTLELPIKGSSFPNSPLNIKINDYWSQVLIDGETYEDSELNEAAAYEAFTPNLQGLVTFKYPKALYNSPLSDIQVGGFSVMGDDADSSFSSTPEEDDEYIIYNERYLDDMYGCISGVTFSFIP